MSWENKNIPKVCINMQQKEKGDVESRAACGICNWALVHKRRLRWNEECGGLCLWELWRRHGQKIQDIT